jgi:hypothetical protein
MGKKSFDFGNQQNCAMTTMEARVGSNLTTAGSWPGFVVCVTIGRETSLGAFGCETTHISTTQQASGST